MPVPGVSPYYVPDAVCPACSLIMRSKVVAAKSGVMSHVLYACDACKYAFSHIPQHLNGEFKGYSAFPAPEPTGIEKSLASIGVPKADTSLEDTAEIPAQKGT